MPAHIQITPRDYQVEAIDKVARAYKAGRRRVCIVLPTGTGKTVVFSLLLARRGGRTLVLAHRDELIRQAVQKIQMVWPEADCGIVRAEENQINRQIVVASVQTLSRERRLDSLPADFQTVVIDEAHHATAESYRKILERLGCFLPEGPLTVGVTATPDRSDGVALGSVFEEIVYERGIADFMPHRRPDGLCDLITLQVNCNDLDLDQIKRSKGDYRESDLAAKMTEIRVTERIAAAWQAHAGDRKTIWFLPSVDLAYDLVADLESIGIKAAGIDGTLERDERRDILDRFASDDLQVLTNCQVATEGFDEPSISCVGVARPTQSRSLYTQMIGRGLRPYPTKENCLVLDVVGVSGKHSPCGVADLFGLDASKLKKGVSVSKALVAKDEEKRKIEAALNAPINPGLSLYQGHTKPVDAMGKLNWVRAHAGLFILSLGDTILKVEKGYSNEWHVVENGKSPAKLIADRLTQSYAIGVAESRARELVKTAGHTLTLAEPKAKWRHEPPSEKQIKLLRQLGVHFDPEKISKGRASDLITAARFNR